MHRIALILLAGLLCACRQTSNAAMAELGQAIFEDPSLSADGKTSCTSCHKPELDFTDGRPTSLGVFGRPSTRNAPSLSNDVRFFFWDSRESDLSKVVMQPFTTENEMGLSGYDQLLIKLNSQQRYSDKATAAYGHSVLNYERTARALVMYLETLKTRKSRFDLSLDAPQGKHLSMEETEGLELFRGKAGCAQCHRIDDSHSRLTDDLHHHSGVGFSRASGRIKAAVQLLEITDQQDIGKLILANPRVSELGRFVVSRSPQDLGAFRTPSLRNVSRTAPYMHDGSIPDLSSAVDYELYYRGLAQGDPVHLTPTEKRRLLEFLRALDFIQ